MLSNDEISSEASEQIDSVDNNGLTTKLMTLVLKPDPLMLSARGNRGLILANIGGLSPPTSAITSTCSTPLPTPISADRPSSAALYSYDNQPQQFYGTGELQRTIQHHSQQEQSPSSATAASTGVAAVAAQITPCPFFSMLEEDSRFALFSNTGRFFVYYTSQGVRFLDVDAHVHLPFSSIHTDSTKARRCMFSPRDTYFVLWDAQQLNDQTTACKIYRTETLELVGRFYQFQRPEWLITFASDEQLMVRQSGGETWFHETAQFLTKQVLDEHCSNPNAGSSTTKKQQLPYSIRLDSGEMHIKGAVSISPFVVASAITSTTSTLTSSNDSPGTTATQLSYHVAMFHQSRDRSGFIRMYKYPNIEKPQQAVQQRAVQQHDHVQFLWNARGTHCVAQAWAETDVTSKNYYGAMQLILFQVAHAPPSSVISPSQPILAPTPSLALQLSPVPTAMPVTGAAEPPPRKGGNKKQQQHATPSSSSVINLPVSEPFVLQFKREGPIHAFKWLPLQLNSSSNTQRNEPAFIVTYGNMPNMTGLFDCNGTELYAFPTNGYSNEILFNSFGNILCLYGSGNVQPTLSFWDMTKVRQPKAITRGGGGGENVIHMDDMTYVEWAPDGIHLVTATTTPRLRVKNGFKFIHFATGQVLAQTSYGSGELYQVQFRPQPDVYKAPNIKREARFALLLAKDAAAAAAAGLSNNKSIVNGVNNNVDNVDSEGGDAVKQRIHSAAAAAVGAPKVAYVPPHMRKQGILASTPKHLPDNIPNAAAASIPVGVDGSNKSKPALPPGGSPAKGGAAAAARPPRIPVGMAAAPANGAVAGGGKRGKKANKQQAKPAG